MMTEVSDEPERPEPEGEPESTEETPEYRDDGDGPAPDRNGDDEPRGEPAP